MEPRENDHVFAKCPLKDIGKSDPPEDETGISSYEVNIFNGICKKNKRRKVDVPAKSGESAGAGESEKVDESKKTETPHRSPALERDLRVLRAYQRFMEHSPPRKRRRLIDPDTSEPEISESDESDDCDSDRDSDLYDPDDDLQENEKKRWEHS